MRNFVLKGNICFCDEEKKLQIREKAWVVCEDGICRGVFDRLPEAYRNFEVKDMKEQLILPALTDLHTHAPQYAFRGLGMDLELLDWLDTHTFPEEAKYADPSYAEKAYRIYTEDLKKNAVTRAVIFGTLHVEATEILMDQLEATGLVTMVGKVNMDRNGGKDLEEKDAAFSAAETRRWLREIQGRYRRTYPILTPRFIPSCSGELMGELKEIQRETGLPVQSHLSENPGEVQWVRELCPEAESYGDAYVRAGLFGDDCPAIMAHCIWVTEAEMEQMRKRGVYAAHCPQSNANLSSGIAPVRRFLQKGIPTGLGSDIAAGSSVSVLRAMADAVQVSKLRWRLVDQREAPLTLEEAFYLGTLGGGTFFGKVGSFLDGYEFDAVVFDDGDLPHPQKLDVRSRLERLISLADDRQVVHKYVRGTELF